MLQTGLHEQVLQYRSSGQGKDSIMESIAIMLYKKYRLYGFDSEDDAANVYLCYQNRIARMIDRYEDIGFTFDVYLASNLRFLARSMRRDRKKQQDKEGISTQVWSVDLAYEVESQRWDSGIVEHSDSYWSADGKEDYSSSAAKLEGQNDCLVCNPTVLKQLAERQDPQGALTAFRNRILFIAVKYAHAMTEDKIINLSNTIMVSLPWLCALMEQARSMMLSEQAKKDILIERRNSSWQRIHQLQSRQKEDVDSVMQSQIAYSLRVEMRQFASLSHRINTFSMGLSNALVATLLNIPKGTVDSGIYHFKKRYFPDYIF